MEHWADPWGRLSIDRHCISSVLGVVSVLCWGVAEIPQILTNYKAKSTDGISVLFNITWIVGDVLNVIGCWLEPATLPTQFFMALLFTATTLVLSAQKIYYSCFYRREDPLVEGSRTCLDNNTTEENQVKDIDRDGQSIESNDHVNRSAVIMGLHQPSIPIPVACSLPIRYGSSGRDLYYMSARSLSMSPKPRVGLLLAHPQDLGRISATITDQETLREPFLSGLASSQHTPPKETKNMLCLVSSSVFFVGGLGLHLSKGTSSPSHGVVLLVGRKLLQEKYGELSLRNDGGSSGSILGWAMAAIYMGGRLPQIYLNITRGNAEGLDPLMFIFALFGNATYIASILVRSLDWSKIHPNLPWLVDAGGCVLLDIFIICQFFYFWCQKAKDSGSRNS